MPVMCCFGVSLHKTACTMPSMHESRTMAVGLSLMLASQVGCCYSFMAKFTHDAWAGRLVCKRGQDEEKISD